MIKITGTNKFEVTVKTDSEWGISDRACIESANGYILAVFDRKTDHLDFKRINYDECVVTYVLSFNDDEERDDG